MAWGRIDAAPSLAGEALVIIGGRQFVFGGFGGVVGFHSAGETGALDRLRAEGFVEVSIASPALKNRAVRIEVTGIGAQKKTLSGVITFVGQEVDPLNQQVRIWAEFESPELDVYPGMTAEMTILPARSQTGPAQPATAPSDDAESTRASTPLIDSPVSADSSGER